MDDDFVKACYCGDLDEVKAIINDHEYDPDFTIEFDRLYGDVEVTSPLSYAVRGESIEVVQYLILKGLDPNNDQLEPPIMHIAVRTKNRGMIKILLNNGAEANILDRKHSSPLHWAVFDGNYKIVKLLIKSVPADQRVQYVNAYDDDDITPLYLARLRGLIYIEELLIKYGAINE